MNWFQHDTDSTQDAKIKKLIIRHGAVGYAIYFHCLELIASDISESNLTFELEHDSEIIADNLHIQGTSEKSGREVVEMIMTDIVNLGLFTEDSGRIFCFKLLKRINLSMTSNPAFRGAISKKKEEYHDGVMTRHDTVMRHYITLPTLQEKKEESVAKASPSVSKRFTKPTLEEVKTYCLERKNRIDAQSFLDFYESKGWKVGNTPMKDWKAAVRTWESRETQESSKDVKRLSVEVPDSDSTKERLARLSKEREEVVGFDFDASEFMRAVKGKSSEG